MARRRRARSDDGQLPPVDAVGRQRAGVGEEQDRAAGLDRGEGRLAAARCAEHGSVDRAVGRDAGPVRMPVDREHRVAAVLEHGPEEATDEAVADDEHPAPGYPLGATEDARERLDVRPAGVVDGVRQLDPAVGADPLGEAAGNDRRLRELLARRLVAGEAAAARAAAGVVDQGDAAAVRLSRRRPRARAPCRRRRRPIFSTSDPQSPQASTVDELARRRRIGDLGEAGLSVRP